MMGGPSSQESLLSSNNDVPYHLKFVLFQALSHPVIFCLHITSGIEVLIPISQMGKLMKGSGDSGHKLPASCSLAVR